MRGGAGFERGTRTRLVERSGGWRGLRRRHRDQRAIGITAATVGDIPARVLTLGCCVAALALVLGAAIGHEAWPVVVAVAGVVALAALWALPAWVAVALAIVLFRSVPDAVVGPLSVSDVLILVWVYRRLLEHRLPSFRRADIWLLGFLAVGFVSTFVHGIDLAPMLRIALYGAVFLYATLDAGLMAPVITTIRRYAIGVVLVSAAVQLPGRMTGVTIGDPQQLGVLVLAALAFGGSDMPRWQRVLLWFGVAATLTRGVWLAAAVLLAVQRRPRRSSYVATALAVAVIALLLYGPVTSAFELNPESAQLRSGTIESGLEAGIASPLLGTGWAAPLEVVRDETGRVVEGRPPFNVLVAVFAYLGICGVGAYGMFLWSSLGTLQHRCRDAFVFAATFIVLSMVEPLLYAGSLATFLFFLLTGLGRSMSPLHSRSRTPVA